MSRFSYGHFIDSLSAYAFIEQHGFLDTSRLESVPSYYEEKGFTYMRPVWVS